MYLRIGIALLLLGINTTAQKTAAAPSSTDKVPELFASTSNDKVQPSEVTSDTKLTLDKLLAEVTANAPDVIRAKRLADAQRLRAQAESGWPAPTATISYAGSPTPFRTMEMDPSSYRGLNVMQELPLGGKRKLREAIAAKQADTMALDGEAALRELRRRAARAFNEYLFTTHALQLSQEDGRLLGQISSATAARYGEGRASGADVSRAQIEETLLRRRVLEFERQRDITRAEINALLGHHIDAPLPTPEEPAEELLLSLASVTQDTLDKDPQVHQAKFAKQRANLDGELARRDAIPSVSVGYMYQQRPGMADMYGMQFSVSIPFFQKQQRRQMSEAARLDMAASDATISIRRREIVTQLAKADADARNAWNTAELYRSTLLPQYDLALRIAQSAYAEGTGSLTDTLMWASQRYNYQIEIARMQADYRNALAEIESITGEHAEAKQ